MMRLHWQYLAVLLCGVFLFIPNFSHAESWSQIGFGTQNIYVVTPDIGNKDHILASVMPGTVSEIRYTYDGGKTWTKSAISGYPCTEIKQNPKILTEYWAACSGGVYHSTDEGKSFSKIPSFVSSDNHISIANDGVIYIAIANTEYRSVDGVLWEKGGFANTFSTNAYISVDPNNSNVVYVSRTGDYAGLYKTIDGGKTWNLISNVTQFRSGITGFYILRDGTLCAAYLTNGVAYSTNGGLTWSSFSSPDPIIKGETGRIYGSYQNYDDPDNIIITNVGQNGSNPRVYSTEGTDLLKTKSYALPGALPSVAISQGVIFTSSGSFTKGVWSSEGIAVKPSYLEKYPIIVIPGVLGSWQYVSGGKYYIDPIFHSYDNLVKAIKDNGYTEGVDLFTFPYNWRQDNHISAIELKGKINEAKQKSGLSKVKLVAHSMGGLVARDYAESDGYENDIDSIVFLGTPHLGSPEAYPAWEAGEMAFGGDIAVSNVINFFLSEEAHKNGYSRLVDYIRSCVPSVGQLLPVYDYLGWFNNTELFAYPTFYPRNSYLEGLGVNKGRLATRGIKITNIVTDNIKTPIIYKLVTYLNLGNIWQDGFPVNYGSTNEGIIIGTGDGTVVSKSSEGLDSNSLIIEKDIGHSDLQKKAVNDVLLSLGLARGTDGINQLIENRYLLIKAYSPVSFYVISPSGKRVGYNNAGVNYAEIGDSFYSGEGGSSQFAVIPEPEDGNYQIVTVGTGIGKYKIESTYIDKSMQKNVSKDYEGVTSIGSEQRIDTALTASTDSIVTKIEDNTRPRTSIEVVGGDHDYYTTDVAINLNATDDISGIKSISYSLDDINWYEYKAPVVISKEGENLFYYRSEDYAGNIEDLRTHRFVIDKLKPTMLVSTSKQSYTHWETMFLKCSVSDIGSGVLSSSVEINGRNYSCQDQNIKLDSYSTGTYFIKYNSTDKSGNNTSDLISFFVTATIPSTSLDLAQLNSAHKITRSSYILASVWLSVADVCSRIHLTKSRNDSFDRILQILDSDKRLMNIDETGYNLIKDDVIWLKK